MASRFWVQAGNGGTGTWDGSDTTNWGSSSGGAGGQSVPGSSDTVTFDANSFAAVSNTCTVNTDFSITSLTCGAMNGVLTFATNNNSPTFSTVSLTGTGTRTINLGSGTFTITGTGTCMNLATGTNLTFDGGTSKVRLTNSSATTKTFNNGANATWYDIDIVAGSGDTAITNFIGRNIDFTGYTGNVTTFNPFLTGNLTYGTGMTFTSSTNTVTFSGTSGTQLFTVASVVNNRPVTINAPGATVRLVGNLDITGASARTLTLTAGTFDDDGYTITASAFASSGSTTRHLIVDGTWNLTNNNATIWNTGVMTGFTLAQTGAINLTYSGSTGTRTITSATAANGATETNVPSLNITAGSDALLFSTARIFKSLNFTGYSGVCDPNGPIMMGNLTFSSNMTTLTDTFSFQSTSGTNTITSNGNTGLALGLTFNGVGGTWQLADAFVGTGAITVTNGTFNTGSLSLTAASFSSSNSNTRGISLGSSTITLTGTGTVWTTATTTGLTFDAGTSTVKITDASSSSKTFASGALTFYDIWLTGAGTGTFIMGTSTSPMTLHILTVDTAPHTVQFFAGKTITITDLDIIGTSSNLMTLQSTTNGSPWYLVGTTKTVDVQYASLRDSYASGVDFNAYNSVDVSNNSGWDFLTPPANQGKAPRDGNFVPSKLAVLNTDTVQGATLVPLRIDPDNEGLRINTTATISFTMVPIDPRDPNFVTCWLFQGTDGLTYPAVATIDGELLIDE